MKKLIAIISFTIFMFALASCSPKPVVQNNASNNTQVNSAWFSQVEFSDTALNDFNARANHHKIFLPTNIEESLRKTTVDVTELLKDPAVKHFNVQMATTASSTTIAPFRLGFLTDLLENSANIDLEFLADAALPQQWSSQLDINDNLKEATTTYIYTIYLPVLFETFVFRSPETFASLVTHIIIPISFGFAQNLEDMPNVTMLDNLPTENGRLV